MPVAGVVVLTACWPDLKEESICTLLEGSTVSSSLKHTNPTVFSLTCTSYTRMTFIILDKAMGR